MSDVISRAVVLRCIMESRENIDWGQSEDGDAFLHYTGALYRTVASPECIPAVDAAPVVHGRWVISPGSPWPIRDCSVCGEQQISAYATKYCPNCGAKMDLEV